MAAPTMEIPPPMQLMHMLMGFMVTRAISSAANMGIADVLKGGPKYYTDIAKAIKAEQKAVHRLMRALTSVGVFAEPEPGKFALTPISQFLVKDTPGSLAGMAKMITTPSHWLPWGRFDETLQAGISCAEKVLGGNVFDYYKCNPVEGQIFAEAMSSFSSMTSGAVAQAYDFKQFKKIADVGGGHGFLLATILNSAPKAKGVLYDLPEVVKEAGPLLHEVKSRVEIKSGSFFDSVPEGCDCYVMKHIIHDWDDARCTTILKNIRKVMAPGAKVAVVEILMPDKAIPDPSFLMDINMLAMTPGGCERTEQGFKDLFKGAGLKLNSITRTMSPAAVMEAVAG